MTDGYRKIKEVLRENGLMQNDLFATGRLQTPLAFTQILKGLPMAAAVGAATLAAGAVIAAVPGALGVIDLILNIGNAVPFTDMGEDEVIDPNDDPNRESFPITLADGDLILTTFKGSTLLAVIRVGRKDVKRVSAKESKNGYNMELTFRYNDGKEVRYSAVEPHKAMRSMITRFYNP